MGIITTVILIDMIMIVGLILWGVSIDKNYHWMVGQAAFFLCNYPMLLSGPFPELYITNSYIQSQQESKLEILW